MGIIQSSIDRGLQAGSLLLTQTPVYKMQMSNKNALERFNVKKESFTGMKDEKTAKEYQSAAYNLYQNNPTPENLSTVNKVNVEISEWKKSLKQAQDERLKKQRQEEFYKNFMGVLNNGK